VGLALACGWMLAGATAHAADGLGAALDAALGTRALRGASVGALVVARDDGRVLYARNADAPLIPASNQKLLTATAALAAFGPTHLFPLDVLTSAPPDAAGAVETLYLRGSGGPTLTSEDFWRLAADLRMAGVTRIRGGLVIDAGAFDAERWNPRWGPVSARAYHAPAAAVTVNYGAYAVVVRPGAAVGEPVRVHVDPMIPYLRVVNRAITGKRGSRPTLAVGRSSGEGFEAVEVTGSAAAGSRATTYYRSVADPVGYADAVLRMQLAANGIEVAGPTQRGAVPDEAVPLLAFEGHPVAEIVRRCLKFSNNVVAESLVKALGAQASGAPGSWENGVPALRAALAQAGLPLAGVVLADGSGLAYDNRVTPRLLVAALRYADDSFDFGPEFLAGLPIAGRDGTLKKRTGAALDAIRAKTGLLTRVTALAGLARLADGGEVVFALMVNDYKSSDDGAMRAVDGFATALVGSRTPAPPP